MNNHSNGNHTNSESGEENGLILMVFRILVFVVGILGNMAVIFVIVVLKEHRRTISHWYVLQLAIADSMFLLNIPFKIVEDRNDEWIFSGTLCKMKETVLFLNYYSSILFLMLMSIDRYMAVCHRFSRVAQSLRARRSAYIITVIVWMLSLLLCIPIMLYSDKRGIEPNCHCHYAFPKSSEEICELEGMWTNISLREECLKKHYESKNSASCVKLDWNYDSYEEYNDDYHYDYYDDTDYYEYGSSSEIPEDRSEEIIHEMGCSYAASGQAWSTYLIFNFVAMFILPLLVMSACYSLIAFRLRRSRIRRSTSANEVAGVELTELENEQRNRESPIGRVQNEKSRIRITFTCFILVLLFLVCWLPFHAVHLAKIRGIPGKSSEYCRWIAMISSLFGYVNSAINPYVYNFIGTKFGKRFRLAVKMIRTSVKKRTVSSSPESQTKY
ncbi:somatostatin receptor type 2-like isoform X2 [Styela clava]|uniref:kappa-type opioid receptor-like isoform X2 n=1 Tax=Styela clava TaxID=7725 RepID=UPI00193AD718|nr:kappa-type opioid receptor-like isoform X2 [Styela clava]